MLFEINQYGSIITSSTSYIDLEYIEGQTVYYRISALDHAGNRGTYSQTLTVSSSLNSDDINNLPTEFRLHQNYPNPFNPSTIISYDLPSDGFINISIHDSKGRLVKTLLNKKQSAGFRSISWNSLDKNGDILAAGLYFYSITTNESRQSMKMILLK